MLLASLKHLYTLHVRTIYKTYIKTPINKGFMRFYINFMSI